MGYGADMKIGEIAQLAAVPTKTIRYYEEIGLLPPAPRADNGYREYDVSTAERLRFIKDAQSANLSLAEIHSILDMRDHGEKTCRHVIDLLERHLADIDRQIRTLRRTRKKLAEITERARQLDPADCTDPNRCQTIAAAV